MTFSSYGGPIVSAIELDAYKSAAGSLSFTYGWGTSPHGTLEMTGSGTESVTTIRGSDFGYRTKQTDAGGLKVFPPRLTRPMSIDRRVLLDPGRSWGGVAWGEVRLRMTPEDEEIVATYNTDGRDARFYFFRKTWCPVRRIWLDPPLASIAQVFKGLCGPWRIDKNEIVVPFRDPGYWLEKPLQPVLYAGTGGLEGPAALKGIPKPRARGGTSGNPIRNVGLVLVDPANLIYQYTDGPGTVVTLYEGGYSGYTFQADTTNLYSGSTSSGQYRTDNSKGLIQLGSQPARIMTADVTGDFPVAGAKSKLIDVIYYTMTEDLLIPAGLIDASAFTSMAASLTYVGGYWYGPTEVSASDVISYLASSMAIFIVPTRLGTLRPWAMRALTGLETPVASLDQSEIVSLEVEPLQAPLDPPAYRWRVGYQRNHTVQETDIAPLVTEARKGILKQEMLMEAWASAPVLASYRRPSDPDPLGGALLASADALTLAEDLGNLFSSGARLYSVEVPIHAIVDREIGDIIRLTYPTARLSGGLLVQIVGERFRPGSSTAFLEVYG